MINYEELRVRIIMGIFIASQFLWLYVIAQILKEVQS